MVTAGALVLSGLDDLAVDLGHHGRQLWRRATVYTRVARARAEDLGPPMLPEAAILVPAWSEGAVIADMLQHLRRVLLYPRYRVFVGLYPNDFATQAAVHSIAGPGQDWLTPVYVDRPGPTSKAHCLNRLFAVARRTAPAFYVLHDAEDVVHPLGLRVMAHLIHRAEMVQLPVIALERRWSDWVGAHYMDEFAEAHAKELVVREGLAGHVPSAGVGCAFRAGALERLADDRGGGPFRPDALTEDYEVALALFARGGRSLIARVPSLAGGGPVATREYFPNRFGAAVRQKARWYMGIVYQGWRQWGWQGSWRVRYVLARDRKAPFAALLSCLSYALVPGLFLTNTGLASRPGLAALLWLTLGLALWRAAHRCLYTGLVYGPGQGALALPRLLVGNLINACAAVRAGGLVLAALARRRPLVWHKTAHSFPDAAALAPFGARLGTLLCQAGALGQDQLRAALAEQRRSGLRLGTILLARGWVDDATLQAMLARQGALP